MRSSNNSLQIHVFSEKYIDLEEGAKKYTGDFRISRTTQLSKGYDVMWYFVLWYRSGFLSA